MTESNKQQPDKKEPSLLKQSHFSKSSLPKSPPPQYVKRGVTPFGKEDPNKKFCIKKYSPKFLSRSNYLHFFLKNIFALH
jgi:hypothetical protein|tara:strand:- start:385 stop:624 length:240 start_codon:yes stop_codon:yes gene_type:complete